MNREKSLKAIDEAMFEFKVAYEKSKKALLDIRNIVFNAESKEKVYSKGREDALMEVQNCESYGYNKGLEDGRNEVWELALKISIMDYDERDEIFGSMVFADIIGMYTPQEALAKLEAYEKEQEIKAGDVVTTINGECGYVVTNVQLPNTLHCINSRNGYTLQMKISGVKKTGKHIDISSILEQIGGGE